MVRSSGDFVPELYPKSTYLRFEALFHVVERRVRSVFRVSSDVGIVGEILPQKWQFIKVGLLDICYIWEKYIL